MRIFAVIGLGNIAKRHRKNLKIIYPNAFIYAVSSSNRIVNEELAYCDTVLSNLTPLLSINLDMVIVASPAPYHSCHTIPFLKKGIPVLIEKPVTASNSDLIELTSMANYYQTPICIGYCLRYLPSANIVKKILTGGSLGTIYNSFISFGQYLPDWRPNSDYKKTVSANKKLGGGALLELSHELDYAQWLLGELTPIHSILRSSTDLGLNVEDIVDVTLHNAKNTICHIHLDFLQKQANRTCSFIGTKARLEWDLNTNTVTLIDNKSSNVIYTNPQWDKNLMYIDMLNDFVRLIENKENECITLSEAANTVKLIEKIKLQAKWIK